MMLDIEDDFLPFGQSNHTTKFDNINYQKGDWVWVFFEGGNPLYPVIFDRVNIKDFKPSGSDGEEPNWFGDIEANSDINETDVTWDGETGKIWSKSFGDNVHISIDEENEQLIIKGTNFWMVMDKDGNYHKKAVASYMTFDEKFNIAADEMLLKMGNNTIEATSEGVIINENWKVLV